MASLEKQLGILSPFLNKDLDERDLYKYLLSENPEEYYEENYANLIYSLGRDPRQENIYTLPANIGLRENRNFVEDVLLVKLRTLLEKETKSDRLRGYKEDGIWNLEIDSKTYELGEISKFYNWHVQGDKLLTPPDFFSNMAKVFQEHISAGRFYYGFLSDNDQRKRTDFIYVILFVKNEDEPILKKLKYIQWQPLYQTKAELDGDIGYKKDASRQKYKKHGRISYIHTEGSTEIVWKNSHLYVSMLVWGLVLISLMDVFNPYLNNLDHGFPDFIAKPLYLTAGIFFILYFINRSSKIILTPTHFYLKKGLIPIFLGYRRKTIPINSILRTDLKASDMDEGNEVATTGTNYMYKVYLTLFPTKKVRVTNLLSRDNAEFVLKKIEKHLEQYRQ